MTMHLEPIVAPQPSFRFMMSNPAHVVSLGFGTGLSPVWPGTVAALAGIPAYLLLALLPFPAMIASSAVIFLVGAVVCHHTGSSLQHQDHPSIVLDELWATATVLMFVPADPRWWVLAFVLFRAFDILKLWPADEIDRRMKNGLGVMLDDGFAAVQTVLVVQMLHLW